MLSFVDRSDAGSFFRSLLPPDFLIGNMPRWKSGDKGDRCPLLQNDSVLSAGACNPDTCIASNTSGPKEIYTQKPPELHGEPYARLRGFWFGKEKPEQPTTQSLYRPLHKIHAS
jgi:hypothetical protein